MIPIVEVGDGSGGDGDGRPTHPVEGIPTDENGRALRWMRKSRIFERGTILRGWARPQLSSAASCPSVPRSPPRPTPGTYVGTSSCAARHGRGAIHRRLVEWQRRSTTCFQSGPDGGSPGPAQWLESSVAEEREREEGPSDCAVVAQGRKKHTKLHVKNTCDETNSVEVHRSFHLFKLTVTLYPSSDAYGCIR